MKAVPRLPRIRGVSDTPTVELDAQYRQLREVCGLLDRSARGKLLIEGPDAAEYLQGQLTNEIEALSPGEGCYAALLDRKGHMQADMRVLRLGPEKIWLDTEPEALGVARRHLETYKIGREVEVENAGEDHAILSLIGPAAAAIATAPSPPLHGSETGVVVCGVECVVVGTEDGIDLIAPAEGVGRLRDGLVAAGAAEVDPGAAEIVRIESGRPRFGAEMTTATMPAEAGIVDAAVSFTKGCYIGQEPVARLHHRGKPNRHLRGLRLDGPAETGDALLLGDKEVGRVGSFCVSPAHGPIALAIVRREAEPGAELAVGEAGVTARVVDLPFG
jgi:tRNA-modifying protein YgfZ